MKHQTLEQLQLFPPAPAAWEHRYRDPRWLQHRKQLWQDRFEKHASPYTCDRCGSGKQRNLHWHHNYYVAGRWPWQYPRNAFALLCPRCHKASHARERTEKFQDPLWVAEQNAKTWPEGAWLN